MHTAIRWLDVLFGKGDDNYPFWLLTVRLNVLLFFLCSALVIAWNVSPARMRKLPAKRAELYIVLGLTGLAAGLRFGVASANLMDFGGIAYSRMLLGYKGYFATAQFFSPMYMLTARDIEHAILFNRLAGTLTIPLVYVICRRLHAGAKLFPVTAAFLFAVYPLHILFSASDMLAVFSCFLAAASYALLTGAPGLDGDSRVAGAHYVGGCVGLTLLTQVRYENVLFLIPAALAALAARDMLRRRQLVVPLAISTAFLAIYAYEASTSGLSHQNPIDLWRNLDMVARYLAMNPFLAVPVLLVGTLAVWAYKGPGLGVLALLPWLGAFILCVLAIEDGHGAARIYANWLILILPFAGYGFALMLSAPRRWTAAVAAVAILYLGAQPIVVRDRLLAQHLEILENNRFKALLTNPPGGVKWIIVPDDDVMARQPHSTWEVFNKYNMIRAGSPEAARRSGLVRLTEYLERPQQTSCAPGECVFFFGLPCMEPELFPVTTGECQELLRTHRTSILEETTVVAAPFVYCSIYTGNLREQLCDPVTKAQRFAVYRIEESIPGS